MRRHLRNVASRPILRLTVSRICLCESRKTEELRPRDRLPRVSYPNLDAVKCKRDATKRNSQRDSLCSRPRISAFRRTQDERHAPTVSIRESKSRASQHRQLCANVLQESTDLVAVPCRDAAAGLPGASAVRSAVGRTSQENRAGERPRGAGSSCTAIERGGCRPSS